MRGIEVKKEVSGTVSLKQEKKVRLFKELIGKILVDESIDASFSKYLNENHFLGDYNDLFKNIFSKVHEQKEISEQFLVETYGIIPINSDKNQHEIIEQLDDIYFEESLNDAHRKFEEEKANGINGAYKKFVDRINQIKLKLEKVSLLSLHDEDSLEKIYQKMTDETNKITFGMDGFDDLVPERGQLVAFLGGTGSGKSIVLQKLTASALEKNYKVCHFSLELSEVLFMKRLISALGWFPYKNLISASWYQFRDFIRKFRDFNSPKIVTIEKGRVNVAKVEKVVQIEKPDVVFIDYIQIMNEDFDPMSSKASVSQQLNELAIKYNCLVVIGIQTNDEGRRVSTNDKGDGLPELGHIKKMKAIADDCTFVVSLASERSVADPRFSNLKFKTRKHRNDFFVNFTYRSNLNIGKWELVDIEKGTPSCGQKKDEETSMFGEQENES